MKKNNAYLESRDHYGYGLSEWEIVLHCNVLLIGWAHIQNSPWGSLNLHIDILFITYPSRFDMKFSSTNMASLTWKKIEKTPSFDHLFPSHDDIHLWCMTKQLLIGSLSSVMLFGNGNSGSFAMKFYLQQLTKYTQSKAVHWKSGYPLVH